jgi:hypothetical protein
LVIVLLHNLSFPASAFAAALLLLGVHHLNLIAIRLLQALFVWLVGLLLVLFFLLLHSYLFLLGFAEVAFAPITERSRFLFLLL